LHDNIIQYLEKKCKEKGNLISLSSVIKDDIKKT
jgi:hypothetical protein